MGAKNQAVKIDLPTRDNPEEVKERESIKKSSNFYCARGSRESRLGLSLDSLAFIQSSHRIL